MASLPFVKTESGIKKQLPTNEPPDKKRHFLSENAIREKSWKTVYLTRSSTAAKKPSV